MHVFEFGLRCEEGNPGVQFLPPPPDAELDGSALPHFQPPAAEKEARVLGNGHRILTHPPPFQTNTPTGGSRRRLLGDCETCGKEKRFRRAGSAGDTIRATDKRGSLELHTFW